MLHVPDTGPGKRVPGAGARTEGREASRQSSEVGAVCRKAARTVLCGGRPVMGVPTAIDRKANGSETLFVTGSSACEARRCNPSITGLGRGSIVCAEIRHSMSLTDRVREHFRRSQAPTPALWVPVADANPPVGQVFSR